MARTLKLDGVEPKQQITLKTALTFDKDAPGGHALVGKAVAVGTIAGGAVAPTADATLLGQLILLEPDGYATIKTLGVVKLPYTGSLEAGDQVVCSATIGAVKKAVANYAANSGAGSGVNGRGTVLPASAGAGFAYILLT